MNNFTLVNLIEAFIAGIVFGWAILIWAFNNTVD